MGKRKSYHLSRLQSELRARAIKEKDDEELSNALWRMYYKARNAEHEIREMVMDAEMRRLLEFVFPDGVPQNLTQAEVEKDETPQPEKSEASDDTPKQKGFWD